MIDSPTAMPPPEADALGTKRSWARLAELCRDVVRALRLYHEAAPRTLVRLGVCALVSSLSAVAVPYTTKRILDSVRLVQDGSAPEPATDPMVWLLAELLLIVASEFAVRRDEYLTEVLRQRGALNVLCRVLERASNVSYSWFSDPAFANRLTRLCDDVPVRSVEFVSCALNILRDTVLLIGSIAVMSTTFAWALPCVAVCVLPSFLADLRKGRRAFHLEQACIQRHRRGAYLQGMITDESSAKELRVLGAASWFVKKFRSEYSSFTEGRVALAAQHRRTSTAVSIAAVVVIYGPYAYCAALASQGKLTLGDMVLFVMVFGKIGGSLKRLLLVLSQAIDLHPYVRNILDFVEPAGEVIAEPCETRVFESAPDLLVDNLWFQYPTGNQPVLRGFSLHVRAGERVAIIGRNGMGKSTMLKLLLGLYTPERGRISIGGIDVAHQSPAWLRDNIGVVFQDFGRYHFDVAANVGLGWVTQVGDTGAVMQALDNADAGPFVSALPEGVRSALGTTFGGRDISGGEWQRIALARLFMRKSRVWILDEPTAAMDPLAEEQTFRRLCDNTRGRTVIFVTHRVSTARLADRIALVHEGRVEELGNHDQLMALNGRYAELFQMQARAYLAPVEPKVSSITTLPEPLLHGAV